MLSSITINNVALIENLTVEFGEGLNVLSGETGAGKSLVIDSISLLLGERADKTLISYGKDFALVEAVFCDVSKSVLSVLEEFGQECEDKLIITRKITKDGKNEIRVNGRTYTLSMLKKLTAPLMDLHGQFEHQSLLNVSNHIKILDGFAKNKIEPKKEKYQKVFNEYNDCLKSLSNYTVDEKERERLIDLYNYQINEIENANFVIGEDEELKAKQMQFVHAEKIAEALSNSINLLSDGYEFSGCLSIVSKIISNLSQVSSYYSPISNLIERLDGVKIELEDISSALETNLSEVEVDEFEMKRVEERLDLLSSFRKKYGSTITQINEYLKQIKDEYNKLINCNEILQNLTTKKSQLEGELLSFGEELSGERKLAAQNFENAVNTELKELGMNGCKFLVSFEKLGLQNAKQNGIDDVEFLFSANVGQPPKPLAKVISGGEMSRFMLALKNITADIDGIATMIFDEIDTGVSGQMAKVLAQKMLKVGFRHQVICVTHMAQICAFANHNFYIEKVVENGKTITKITAISGQEKVREVSRLVGSSSSQSAFMHAQELILEGQEFYKSLK